LKHFILLFLVFFFATKLSLATVDYSSVEFEGKIIKLENNFVYLRNKNKIFKVPESLVIAQLGKNYLSKNSEAIRLHIQLEDLEKYITLKN